MLQGYTARLGQDSLVVKVVGSIPSVCSLTCSHPRAR